jgi:hypothetical protein
MMPGPASLWSYAKAFGIAFDLAEDLRPIDAPFGHALAHKDGDDSWILPIPAPYVIR